MSIKLRAARLWNRCPALVLSPSCYQERADGRTVVGAPMNTLPKLCETFHDRTDASPLAARFLVSNPATVQNVSLLPHSFTLIRGNCILLNSAVAVVLLTGLACPPDHAFVQCVGTGHGRQWQLSCPRIPFPFHSIPFLRSLAPERVCV